MCVRPSKPRAMFSQSSNSTELGAEYIPCMPPAPIPSRNRLPEFFTFEPESAAPREQRRRRSRTVGRKPRRVLYPSGGIRKQPLPSEGSAARRWLIYLCLVILAQICTEEPEQALPLLPDRALRLGDKEAETQSLKRVEPVPSPTWRNLTCYYPEPVVLHPSSLSL